MLRDTDILVTQTAKGIQVVTDVTWLRVGPWSLCYGSKRREGSLSSVAGPLGRFPGFTQARSANLKTLSAPCQKQGTKQEGDLLGKGSVGEGKRKGVNMVKIHCKYL